MDALLSPPEIAALAEDVVAELGGQRYAAEALGTTQPYVSRVLADARRGGTRYAATLRRLLALRGYSVGETPHYRVRQDTRAVPEVVDHPVAAADAPAHVGRKGFWCEHRATDRAGVVLAVDPAGVTVWEPVHLAGTDGAAETTPTAALLFWQQ